MRKTLLITGLFITLMLFSNTAHATSGACSSHNGVNCEAGIDSDGSVVCNDGWRISSVLYVDMKMCTQKLDFLTALLQYVRAQYSIISNLETAYKGPTLITALKKENTRLLFEYTLIENQTITENQKRQINIAFDTLFNFLNLKISLMGSESMYESICRKEDGLNGVYSMEDGRCYTKNATGVFGFGAGLLCNAGYTANKDKTDCFLKTLNEKIFTDIKSDHKYNNAIKYLKDNNIIKGYPDGNFKPDNTVNRAELMKILIGSNLPSGTYENCFKDVKQEWFAPYICYAKEQGWVEGYANGTFKPAQTVNRAEAIKMAIEVFGIDLPESINSNPYPDTDKNQWFAPYIFIAAQKGLFDSSMKNYQPGSGMKRGEVSDIIYRLLAIKKLQVEKYENSLDGQMIGE